ncbi:MAG: ATP-binding protein [Mycobacterium sp.]
MRGVLRRWSGWSLRRQLVVGVSLVVMPIVIAVGVVSTTVLCRAITGIIDSQVDSAADGFAASVLRYRSYPNQTGNVPGPTEMKPLVNLLGQAPGNVIVLLRDGVVVDSALFGDGVAQQAPGAAIDAIAGHPWTGTSPQEVEVPGLGDYRMDYRSAGPGEILVAGVSNPDAERALVQQNVVVASLTLLTLLVTGIGTYALVRYALRPLGRVAEVASEVAEQPLDRDHHTIAARVPDAATDPSTEVGLVGHTLNTLLEHVESAFAAVAASDRRMRQFIIDASHELRTPLTAILGYAELTRQDTAVLPENTEYALARIESESKRMNALVSELLLLARLDERDDLQRNQFDLAESTRDAVNDAAVVGRGHLWKAEIPDEPVWCVGDDAKIHQALANLLSNARFHTPPGTRITARVRVLGAGGRQPQVEITVIDDGPGIAPDLLPHLFERFVRGDTSRSRQAGSTGLGLAIVNSIIQAHDGEVRVSSQPGKTVFRVRLPIGVVETIPSPRKLTFAGS